MTVVLDRDRSGHSLLTVHCDGCPRYARTDILSPEPFCGLIGWQYDRGTIYCLLCQWRRGTVPALARRLAAL